MARILAHAREQVPVTDGAEPASKPHRLPKIGPEDFTAIVGRYKDNALHGPNGVYVQFVEISPTLAAEILAGRNIKNRAFIESNHQSIALAIAEGRFVLKGDTIVFGSNHALLDGQNRLRGIVDGGKTVVTLVMFGVNPDFQAIMDKARPRTHGQSLSLIGYSDTTQLGSALGTLARIKRGSYGYNSPTDERLALLEKHAELTEWIDLAKGIPSKLGVGRVAALAYVMDSAGYGEHAMRMLDIMRDGATEIKPVVISKDDPALRLEKWANNQSGRIPEQRLHNTLLHVANLVMEGKTLGSVPLVVNTPKLANVDLNTI